LIKNKVDGLEKKVSWCTTVWQEAVALRAWPGASALLRVSPAPSHSPSLILTGNNRKGSGKIKVGPDGSVSLTQTLLHDLGFVKDVLCAIAGKCNCDSPQASDADDVLLSMIIFHDGKIDIDLRTPADTPLTSRRDSHLPVALPSGPGESSTIKDGGIMGSYAGGSPGRHAVVDMFYDDRMRVEVHGPGLPRVAEWALFAGAFDDLLDRCVVAAVSGAFLPADAPWLKHRRPGSLYSKVTG
jgi:hypothetical protein